MHILSLGSNCFPAAYIKRYLRPVNKETQLFDTIGTSMWSINKLIEENFEGIIDQDNFKDIQHREGDSTVVTNIRYNLRFLHDLRASIQARSLPFQAKISRRVQRIEGIFREAPQLLLIRYQEIQVRRIQQGPPTDEYAELCRFAALLRSKYRHHNFVIVYISERESVWDEENRIQTVHIPSIDIPWKGCAAAIAERVSSYLPFIHSKLDPPPSAAPSNT